VIRMKYKKSIRKQKEKERKKSDKNKMMEESIEVPLFIGEEDEFCNWFIDAKHMQHDLDT
jgi:hypothetical protein